MSVVPERHLPEVDRLGPCSSVNAARVSNRPRDAYLVQPGWSVGIREHVVVKFGDDAHERTVRVQVHVVLFETRSDGALAKDDRTALTGWLYRDFLYQSVEFRTMLRSTTNGQQTLDKPRRAKRDDEKDGGKERSLVLLDRRRLAKLRRGRPVQVEADLPHARPVEHLALLYLVLRLRRRQLMQVEVRRDPERTPARTPAPISTYDAH